MTQLELFEWAPSAVVVAFPHSRRMAVLLSIADTFVVHGYEAGNKRMEIEGWKMIADLLRLGMPHEEIGGEIEKFTCAARDVASRHIIQSGTCGGEPLPPRPQPENRKRRLA
ncbi:hypothetical protein C5748_25760 [Phyllobacterium phragmitis]|uniref:Uncharacterized protein n=1 Tax=Phyllobacterium phragmitis TaxID=2670329 RepID=A0A2S9IJG7_9HYPH|nr:DUF6074 family protein [Phyllobacterium phragmitis]PRD40674.1 hypothetical protein C5748_25760 [Phyllobacterium phragmitis]